jgi:hypothetical protein
MHRLAVRSRVGSDGVLHIDIPMGKEVADREVQVAIDPARREPSSMTQEDWRQFVMATAGAWQGDLEGLEPLGYEERDDFSERTMGAGAEP